MKNNKGFTLVELLAVIVILAIIMIIAIPAVLDTMETSKKKSLVTFAQKALNEAEKQYLAKQTLGELTVSASVTHFYFDIAKDLDLNNTGNYTGVVIIGISEYDGLYQEITLLDDKYSLSYSTWQNAMKLNENLVKVIDTSLIPAGYDLKNIDWKMVLAAKSKCSKCAWYETANIDAATNTKIFENTPSYIDNYTGDVCNDAENEDNLYGQALYTYIINQSQIGNCDYIRSLS